MYRDSTTAATAVSSPHPPLTAVVALAAAEHRVVANALVGSRIWQLTKPMARHRPRLAVGDASKWGGGCHGPLVNHLQMHDPS